jgi:L-amino acid N-acyltransferase
MECPSRVTSKVNKTMSISIRPATEDDLPRILEITNDAIANTTAVWSLTPVTLESRRKWFEDRRAKGFPVLAADDGTGLQGFATFGEFRPWEGYLHTVEHSVYVHASMRRRGIGRQLLAALIEEAEAMGMHAMIGGIEAGNVASIRLHQEFGFEEVGRLREVGRKFDRWLDMVFMQRLLGG